MSDNVETYGHSDIALTKLHVGAYPNEIYAIADPATGEAWVIDAGYEPRRIASAVRDLKVKGILITHGHLDHHEHLDELRSLLGVPAGIGRADELMMSAKADFLIDDGDEFKFGEQRLRAIHTPGHTPGSTCFLVGKHLFTGDTLFPGGPGNTKTATGDFPTIIHSIRERLFTLPPDTFVYPGHGNDTTIGTEAPHLQEWIDRGW
jgi:glyoxylase-like metal-dependent hydrolase (beta-lactamase superfamily II)